MGVDPKQFEIYRKMSPAQRLRTGCALHDFAYQRVRFQISRKHPEKSAKEINKLVCKRFLNDAAGVL